MANQNIVKSVYLQCGYDPSDLPGETRYVQEVADANDQGFRHGIVAVVQPAMMACMAAADKPDDPPPARWEKTRRRIDRKRSVAVHCVPADDEKGLLFLNRHFPDTAFDTHRRTNACTAHGRANPFSH